MGGCNFFNVLSVIMGMLMLFQQAMHLVFTSGWRRFVLQWAMPPKRPAWMMPAVAGSGVLIVLTWVMYFVSDVRYSLVLAVFMSVGLIKMHQIVFNYEGLRRLTDAFLGGNRAVTAAGALGATILGLVLVWLGVCVY